MDRLNYIPCVYQELGDCRVRFTVDSAWSYGWRIVAWPSQIRLSIRRDDGETLDDINPDLVEVLDV